MQTACFVIDEDDAPADHGGNKNGQHHGTGQKVLDVRNVRAKLNHPQLGSAGQARLNARLSGLPDDESLQTTAAMATEFERGQLASLSMSCASYLGCGHRSEFYGEDGTRMRGKRRAE